MITIKNEKLLQTQLRIKHTYSWFPTSTFYSAEHGNRKLQVRNKTLSIFDFCFPQCGVRKLKKSLSHIFFILFVDFDFRKILIKQSFKIDEQ